MRSLSLKGGFIALFLIFSTICEAKFILQNDQILNEKVINELETIGAELQEKTGVGLYVATWQSLNGQNSAPTVSQDINQILNQKAQILTENLTKPYILLVLTQKEHKVKIYNSAETDKLFDKAQVLSPMPNRGTIIPLLVTHKGKDVYNAAILNGYADIADQVAKSQNIELISSIGNANKDVMNFVRFIFYGVIIFALGGYIFRKFRGKK